MGPIGRWMKTAMLESQTLSVFIEKPWQQVYEALWRPEDFPQWASGLSDASLCKIQGQWQARGPGGLITIEFTEHNAYGVMDHTVNVGGGIKVYVPLRVIANGASAQVLLTLFRQPGMSELTFAEDARSVKRDLEALRALFDG